MSEDRFVNEVSHLSHMERIALAKVLISALIHDKSIELVDCNLDEYDILLIYEDNGTLYLDMEVREPPHVVTIPDNPRKSVATPVNQTDEE